MRFGGCTATAIHDGVATFRPRDLDWNWDDNDDIFGGGVMPFEFGGFLIQRRDRVLIVDLGVSDLGVGPWSVGGGFLDDLAGQGIRPHQVTDVLFTGLTAGRIGWATTATGTATFPNATYRCHRQAWNAAMEARSAVMASLEPLRERFECWDRDGGVVPGVEAFSAAGISPGESVFCFDSDGARVLICGDVFESPLQLIDSSFASRHEADARAARGARESLINYLCFNSAMPVAGCHFPGQRFGRLLDARAGFQWISYDGYILR